MSSRRLALAGLFMGLCALLTAAFLLAEAGYAQQAPAPEPPPASQTPAPTAPAPTAPATPAAPAAAPAEQTAQPAPPPAPVSLAPEVNAKIKSLTTTLDSAEKSLERVRDLGEDIGSLRNEIERVITRSTQLADEIRPRLADIRSQIEKLGPPPAKDQAPEAADVASERTRLAGEAAALDGAVKTLDLTLVRARQNIERITDLRLQLFTQSLLERRSSPVLPKLWTDVARDMPQVSRFLSYLGKDWATRASWQSGSVSMLLAAALAVYLVSKLLISRWTASPPGTARPSFFERAATASWVAPARALPAIATTLIVYSGLDALGLLYYPGDRVAIAVVWAVITYSIVASLIETVLTPKEPVRRLVDLSGPSAKRICRLLLLLTAVYVLDIALTSLTRVLYLPLSISIVQSLFASLLFAGLLSGILLTPFETEAMAAEGRRVPRMRPRWLKYPLWLAVPAIVGAALIGYLALARFVAQQIVMTGVIGLVATLLFLAIRAFTRESGEAVHPVGGMLTSRLGLDAPRRQQIAHLTEAVLTFALAVLLFPVLLLQWGFSGADIRDWLKAAVFGFEIGHFRISLARILVASILFVALLFLTRLLQRWMRDAILMQSRIDSGVAHSIDLAVGYAGTIIAALIAISYAGLDVTNLAIVAGALSVGIGFGLQSIVNNFVSGLILLIERPIKVGDWIIVGNEQGNVKNISVRSTEIETFDKASLIVPNSELVTGRVLNWTHRNSVGRLVIKVATAADGDPEVVCRILEEVATANADVLSIPKPAISFDGFSATELQFTLRVHVGDIGRGLTVSSALRTAILLRFRDSKVPLAPGA